jgi:hypothetical protein
LEAAKGVVRPLGATTAVTASSLLLPSGSPHLSFDSIMFEREFEVRTLKLPDGSSQA